MAPKNGKNVRNPASPLFKKINQTFLWSYRQLQSTKCKSKQKNRTREILKQIHVCLWKTFQKMEYNPFSDLAANIYQNQSRLQRYVDFDQMEYEPIIASALDIYADEMTHPLP
jgi:hypothetical protein